MKKYKSRFREIDKYEREFVGIEDKDYEFGVEFLPRFFLFNTNNFYDAPPIVLNDEILGEEEDESSKKK